MSSLGHLSGLGQHSFLCDYSRGFREVIKDDDLAREAESIEKDVQLTPRESRAKIQSAIEQRYTLPL